LDELEVTVFAVSVDSMEHAQEVKEKGLSFAVAYGATKEDGALIGAWWSEERGGYIQPAEFLLGRGGTVLGAMYASGPVGRMGADEAIRLITRRENIRREEEGAAN
jgi:peroxiredoxin